MDPVNKASCNQDTSRTIEIDRADPFARHFNVSRETMERLEIYAGLLPHWQNAVNLVARSTIDDLWQRHIADSAQLYTLAPTVDTWIDLGSGAGFPGMVIAIMRAEHGLTGVTLIESDQRKCAFLQEVRRQTGIAVDIVDERIENAATHAKVGQADIVSARALAPLSRLFSMAAPLMKFDSQCLFMKGKAVEEELKEASRHWSYQCELVSSITDAQARIVVVEKLEVKLEG